MIIKCNSCLKEKEEYVSGLCKECSETMDGEITKEEWHKAFNRVSQKYAKLIRENTDKKFKPKRCGDVGVAQDTSKEETLSDKRICVGDVKLGTLNSDLPYYVYPDKNVKEFIKRRNQIDIDLQKQLLNDFKTELSEKSAKRFIIARFKEAREDKDKLAGDKLIDKYDAEAHEACYPRY